MIVLKSQQYFFFIILGIGLLLLLVGIFAFKKVPPQIQYVMPIFGGLFLLAGLLFWVSQKSFKIQIEKGKDYILLEEHFRGQKYSHQLDFQAFHHFEIIRSVSFSQNSSGQNSKSIRFTLQLIRFDGAPLILEESSKLDRIFNLSKELLEIIDLPLYIVSMPDQDYQDFFQRLSGLKNAQIAENYPLLDFQAQEKLPVPLNYTLPKHRSFDEKQEGTQKIFTWGKLRGIIPILLFGAIVIGFFFLVHKLVLPKYGWRLASIVAYGFLCFLFAIWLFTLVQTVFGKSQLIFHQDRLEYRQVILGLQISSQEMDFKNLKMLVSNINPQNSGMITVYSQAGLDLLQSLIKEKPSNAIGSLMNVLMNPSRYMLQVDANTFSLGERMYVEEEIWNYAKQVHKP